MNNTTHQQHQGLAKLGLDAVGARVLVVGLGVTGLSVVRFLQANNVQVAVVDSRDKPPGLQELEENYQDVAVFTGGFSDNLFTAATHLVVSPGISLKQAEVHAASQRGAMILGDIDLFAICADAPIACITGSNGKSTVTTLLGNMGHEANWDVRVGGNLGTAALDLITDSKPDLYVLELSSFQLERTSQLNAAVSTVLNVSADHMDRYDDMADYAQTKAKIFCGDGCIVLNRADQQVMAMEPENRRFVTFGLDAPADGQYGVALEQQQGYLAQGDELLMAVAELKIKGLHNTENALAAMALADELGISKFAQHQALANFPGLLHRTQWVGDYLNKTWINDSKATNPGATIAAIEGLGGPLVLIAGGDGKGADFKIMCAAINAHVQHVVLIGQDAQRLKNQAVGDTACTIADSIEHAVEVANKVALQGSTVLLSPACASLDQFVNYQERGQRFIAAVEGLQS